MKKLFIYTLAILITLIGCSGEDKETTSDTESVQSRARKVEVVEHLEGGGYTFLKANENGNEIWLAVRSMPVEAGDVYYFTDAMEMKNFESKSLNKTFESILFVNDISKTAGSNASAAGHSGMPGMASADGHTKPKVEATSDIKVTPLSDGKTVEAVNNEKASLAGKTVKVRGVVTKYNGGIMNRNWLHIQDGTGDLTITSDQSVKVGETVVIEGTVAVDKDFGAGYFYEVIVEDAKITVEKEI